MRKDQEVEIYISKRIYPFTGSIDVRQVADTKRILFEMFLKDPKPSAHLFIDCVGGDVAASIALYDFIKGLPFVVNCTVIGDCHSAALIFMAACEKRYATKHSRFLFHAVTYTGSFKSTLDIGEQVKERIAEHKILFEQSLAIQTSVYRINRDELIQMQEFGEKFGHKLTTDEALQKGVIHQVVEKFEPVV